MSSKVPPAFKPIAHYIKIANENASRDPVVYYWCLFYAVQSAMQLDKSSPDALQYLTGLLTTLEAIKKQLHDNESIKNETIAQAHIEDFALKLFNFADNKEKDGKIDKSVVHAFYTAGHVMDILSLFGEVEEPFLSSKKYAKWKSTQIFACLRDGTPYVPSTKQEKSVDDELSEFGAQFQSGGGNSEDPSIGGSNSYSQPNPSINNIGFAGIPQLPQPPARNQSSYQPPVVEPSYDDFSSQPPAPSSSSSGPSSEVYSELRKYTKYALSAIDYEDVNAVRDNLTKALNLLQKY